MAFGLLLIALGVALLKPATGLPGLAWAALGLAAIPWIQWAGGLLAFSGDAWISNLYLFGLAVAIAAGHRWGRLDARAFAATLSFAFLAAALLSSLIALTQVLEVWPLGMWTVEVMEGMRPGANLAQSNNLATLLGFGALGLLLLREQDRIGRLPAGALFAVLIAGLCVSQSRVSLLFGPLICLGVWLAARRGVRFQTRLRSIGIAAAASWLLLWAEPLFLRTGQILAGQSVAGRGVQSLRFEVWPILLDGLSMHPWRGYGWLQVGAAELAAADRHPPVGELWLQGHNLFIELVVWCGYPLGLLLAAAIVYWFVSRALRVASIEGVIGMLIVAIAGAHSMTEFPYQYAYFLLPLGLWMGLVEASIGSRAILSHKWYLATMLASIALLVAICRDYGAVEEDFRLVRFENLRVGSIHASQPAPDAPFLSSLTAFLRVSRMTPHRGMTSAELDSMRDVVHRYPYAAGMSNYASALALNGRPEEAKEMFTKILHIHGRTMYAGVKGNLHEAALDGAPELRALENSIPP
jgi:hypothetical protein